MDVLVELVQLLDEILHLLLAEERDLCPKLLQERFVEHEVRPQLVLQFFQLVGA